MKSVISIIMFRKSNILVKLGRQIRHSSTCDDSAVKIGVLGVPFEKGQPRIGVGNGPKLIRQAGLIERLRGIHENVDVKDFGDVQYAIDKDICDTIPNMKDYEHMVPCAEQTSKSVCDIIKSGRICLTLGGDHSIGVATVDGHIRAKSENIALLWIDAHADLNTNKTSTTGNIHGMPVALLAKELSDYWPYLPGMDWQKPVISIRNVAYIGLRSVDCYERLIIDKLGIAAFGMADIERHGIDTVLSMALDKVDPDRNKPLHVSFDIDSLDALEAPSTGTSVRGGLTLREGIYIMEQVHQTGRLGAVDMVEINPSVGNEKDVQITVDAAIHILMAAFGHNRRGRRITEADLPVQTFPPKQAALIL